MKKFLAVVKREYLARVRAKMFIVSTFLLPVVMSLFGIVPAIILNIKTPPVRVAVVDQTGKMYALLQEDHSGDDSGTTNDPANVRPGFRRSGSVNFAFEEVAVANRSIEEIRANLDQRLAARELDGYIILPPDFLSNAQAEFFNNNPGDVFSVQAVQSALNRAMREQRLIDANVDTKTRQELFKPVELNAVKIGSDGQQGDARASFALVFGVGFVMYLAILMYGQIILGAVIEEKETRIAEILFSSVRPFTLMMGKLV
ncbi:MAG TPA: ABC transporter permease, partial [Pyrinomonadaceae bacterium]|nr:ABC transporter permease [Pyrinomonadaceae bacterium]